MALCGLVGGVECTKSSRTGIRGDARMADFIFGGGVREYTDEPVYRVAARDGSRTFEGCTSSLRSCRNGARLTPESEESRISGPIDVMTVRGATSPGIRMSGRRLEPGLRDETDRAGDRDRSMGVT